MIVYLFITIGEEKFKKFKKNCKIQWAKKNKIIKQNRFNLFYWKQTGREGYPWNILKLYLQYKHWHIK